MTPFALLCGVGARRRLCASRRDLADLARPRASSPKLRGGRRASCSSPCSASSRWSACGRRSRFERIAERWFSTPEHLVPLAGAAASRRCSRSSSGAALERKRDVAPFFGSVGLFLLCYLGLAISTFPYLVPPSLTIWDTAAVPESQIFTLIGVVFMLPIILGYFAFVFWTFRGKVRVGEGYH